MPLAELSFQPMGSRSHKSHYNADTHSVLGLPLQSIVLYIEQTCPGLALALFDKDRT